MKKRVMTGLLAAFAFLLLPKEVEACSWCNEDSPRCERANYRKCAAYPLEMACDEWYSNCAWVYNSAEVAPDGTIVPQDPELRAAEGQLAGAEVERGCHGLVVERNPTPETVAAARLQTRRILL